MLQYLLSLFAPAPLHTDIQHAYAADTPWDKYNATPEQIPSIIHYAKNGTNQST